MDKGKILQLYPEFKKVYGPYKRKDGRKQVILYDGEKRSARQYSKILIECYLNRRLVDDETVDHIDGDFTNDSIENLQVLDRSEHAKKDAIILLEGFGNCIECGTRFKLSRNQKNKKSSNMAGPFCSKKCLGKYGTDVQNKGIRKQRSEIENIYEQRGKILKCP